MMHKRCWKKSKKRSKMFVYGKHPIIHTDEIFKVLSKKSDDPLKQVVALAYDKRTNSVLAYGVNQILNAFKHQTSAKAVVNTEHHEAKKFLVVHAEENLVRKTRNLTSDQIKNTAILVSTQPCMNCVKVLLEAGFKDVQWQVENRHQEEQELMSPFISVIKYQQNKQGVHLQVPPWLCKESEIAETVRASRINENKKVNE